MIVHDFKIHSSWVSQFGPISTYAFVVAGNWFSLFSALKGCKKQHQRHFNQRMSFLFTPCARRISPKLIGMSCLNVWISSILGVEVVVKQYLGNFLLSMILTCTSFPRRSCDFSDDYSICLRFLEYCSTQDSWAENALFCRSVAVDFGPLMSVAAMVVHVFFAEQCALRMCQTHLHPHRHQMPLPGCVAWFS